MATNTRAGTLPVRSDSARRGVRVLITWFFHVRDSVEALSHLLPRLTGFPEIPLGRIIEVVVEDRRRARAEA